MNATTHAAGTSTPRSLKQGEGYLPILDGWRGIAVLCVLLFHGLLNTDFSGNGLLVKLGSLSDRLGPLGVLIFFCISGYLITQRLLVESRRTGKFSLRAFYIKRFFRIIPPLAVYLMVIVILSAFGLIALDKHDWSAVVFLRNYIPGSWYTGHFWSLSVEEHFYLVWPFCAILLGWRRAMWAGISVILVAAVWRPWVLLHTTHPATVLIHTDMRLDYIMMGCVAALAIEFFPWARRLVSWLGSTAGLVLLLAALVLSTRPTPIDLRSLQALILTLLVCASSLVEAPASKALLANPVMLFLGRISYSLYIWQELFLAPTRNAFLSSPTALPLRYAASLLAAYLSYRLVERPLIAFGRTLLGKKPAVAEPVPPVAKLAEEVR